MVEYVPPTGYSLSAQDQGGNDTTDSDPNPGTGRAAITLSSGHITLDLDAGLYLTSTPPGTDSARIGDRVW